MPLVGVSRRTLQLIVRLAKLPHDILLSFLCVLPWEWPMETVAREQVILVIVGSFVTLAVYAVYGQVVVIVGRRLVLDLVLQLLDRAPQVVGDILCWCSWRCGVGVGHFIPQLRELCLKVVGDDCRDRVW